MPLYAYQCKKCNTEFDQMNSVDKRNESTCPECGNTDNDRHIGASGGFILRGEGFYQNDYVKNSENYQPMDTVKKEK